MLLRDLYQAPFAWNAAAGMGREPVVRLAVPVSLRPGPVRNSANCVGMIFLDRGPGLDPARPLLARSAEIADVRRLRTGLTLLPDLRLTVAVPGGLKAVTGAGCAATAVFTNPGSVFAGSPLAGPGGSWPAGASWPRWSWGRRCGP